MKFETFLEKTIPMIAMAAFGAAAGTRSDKFVINGKRCEPLDALDLEGKAPSKLMLMGPDAVHLRVGKTLAIEVEGADEDRARARFALDDEILAVMSERPTGGGPLTVVVTMPAPRAIVLGGSGSIEVEALARDAEIAIGGSGSVDAPSLDVDTLEVSVAGSGGVRAGGTARTLELSIAGSGDADLAGLTVTQADVSIAGSGSALFASDGEVRATIMGSGNVIVRGGARCRVKSFGSGSLTCERGPAAAPA